jgi:hypothetical protein
MLPSLATLSRISTREQIRDLDPGCQTMFSNKIAQLNVFIMCEFRSGIGLPLVHRSARINDPTLFRFHNSSIRQTFREPPATNSMRISDTRPFTYISPNIGRTFNLNCVKEWVKKGRDQIDLVTLDTDEDISAANERNLRRHRPNLPLKSGSGGFENLQKAFSEESRWLAFNSPPRRPEEFSDCFCFQIAGKTGRLT